MSFTTLIDVAAFRAMAAGAVVLDCRFDLGKPAAGHEAFLAGHIPGARHADLDRDLASPVTPESGRHPLPDPLRLAEFFASLGIGAGTQVVAYDEANGMFAARAWWLCNWLGVGTVAVLDGGLRAWVAAGGALESGEPPLPPPIASRRVAARARPERVTDAAGVLRAIGDPARLVVDARAPERYAGTVEPLDPVAGHVPGAVNHPFGANLAPDGRFLPAAELRRRWTERLGGRSPQSVISMCGSGVTACHNLLAMAVADLPGAQLYAGSWSEWIRDPGRPVARGS